MAKAIGMVTLALVALVGGPAAPSSSAAITSACPLKVIDRAAGWTSIERPEFATMPWAKPGSAEKGARRVAIVPDRPTTMFAASARELFRTTDGGCTWTKVFAPPDSLFLDCAYYDDADSLVSPGCGYIYDVDVVSAQRVFVQVQNVNTAASPVSSIIFVSDDGGSTWTSLSGSGTPGTVGAGEMVVGADRKTIYVMRGTTVGNLPALALYVSSDGGDTWTVRERPGLDAGINLYPSTRDSWLDLIVSPNDPHRLWATGAVRRNANELVQGLFESNDAGLTWKPLTLPVESFSDFAVFEPKEGPIRIALAAWEAGVYTSIDGGATWGGPWLKEDIGVETYTQVLFGANERWLFVIGGMDKVARMDLTRNLAVSVKSRSFSELSDKSGLRPYQYLPGYGLFLMGGCNDGAQCDLILRYSGKGV